MAEAEALAEGTDNVLDLPVEGAAPDSLRRLVTAIKKARERRGWSQRNLAEFAKLNHEAVRRIETGQADPRWTVVSRLAATLNIDLNKVMLGQISASRAERENGHE